MALITCPDCGKEVSGSAPACPSCGRPIAVSKITDTEYHGKGEGIFMKSLNCGCVIAIAFVILIVILMVVGSGTTPH